MKAPTKPKRKYVRKKKVTKPVETPDIIADAPAIKIAEPPKHEHKMPLSVLELLQSRIEDELAVVESGVADLLPPEPTDEEIAEAELRDAALDRVAAALVKLGLSEDDLNLAFGIEPSEARKAKKPKRGKKIPPGQAKRGK